MTTRKRGIFDADDSTCEWIWSTLFARWLRVNRLRMFWIRGKPGSGKSTLMKYLSMSPTARQHLPQGGSPWIVLDFFFDFRQAQELANTIDGLLNTLLHQLSWYIPLIKDSLKQEDMLPTLTSVRSLQSLLSRGLQASEHQFLVLIDGLDEYSGETTYLVMFLKSLKIHKNIKVCLASRPEEELKQQLGDLPHLEMSAYNNAGIEKYIDLAVTSFRPHLDHLKLFEVHKVILERAEGVFLWVHLAIASISKACFRRSPVSEIMAALNALPKELEAMYQRIIDGIPDDWKGEAAILYTLIASSSSLKPSIALLFSTLKFLVDTFHITSLPTELNELDLEDFAVRINATLGGLIELVAASSQVKTEEKFEWTELQVIHETVRAFSEKSKWYEQYLPKPFSKIFPNYIWPRLVTKALLSAQQHVEKLDKFLLPSLQDHHVVYSSFTKFLSEQKVTKPLVDKAPLLYQSMRLIPYFSEDLVCCGDEELEQELELAMRSGFASLHFAAGGPHHAAVRRPSTNMLLSTKCDLALATSHRGFRYLEKRRDRIKNLEDDERDELVSILIRHSLGYVKNCAQIKRGEEGRENDQRLRESVDLILSFNKSICDFHLKVFVRLGYKDMPRFLQVQLAKSETWLSVQSAICNSSFLPSFATQPTLFIWACDRAITLEEDTSAESQLSILLLFGVDINFRDVSGMNVVHYLISQHIIDHTFLVSENSLQCYPFDDMCEGIEKLYLAEKAGADFTYQYKHRTPLQALRRGLDRIRQLPVHLLNLGMEPPEDKLKHLEYILEHKEQTQHLPQPYIGMQVRTKPRFILPRHCDICDSNNQAYANANTVTIVSQHDFVPSRSPRPPPMHRPTESQSLDLHKLDDLASRTVEQPSNQTLTSPVPSSSPNVPSIARTTPRKLRSHRSSSNTTLTPSNAMPQSQRTDSGSGAPRSGSSAAKGPRYLQPTESSRRRGRPVQSADQDQ